MILLDTDHLSVLTDGRAAGNVARSDAFSLQGNRSQFQLSR
jgi:hypothetical protein